MLTRCKNDMIVCRWKREMEINDVDRICKETFPLPIRSSRPSRSPEFPDQARPSSTGKVLKLSTTCSRPSPLERSGIALLVELTGYWSAKNFYPVPHQSPVLDPINSDHFPINTTCSRPKPIPDHSPIASGALACTRSLLDFFDSQNNRVGNPIDADHPDHLPDRFPIAWSGLIELIWSAVGTHF